MSYYFDNEQTSISKEKNIKVYINEQHFSFITDNDVFSKKGLDFGTRTLLESLDLSNITGKVLDFGCGYGPIGIYLAHNNKEVDMLDINKRALLLSRKNAEINNVKVNIFESNLFENVNSKYDFIVTNPPIRVGKGILLSILFGSKDYLTPNGHLIFVVHKDQGAKTLVKKMEEKYAVKVINKNKGFYVIDCRNH